MLIAHKIALAPNNVQRSYLARAAGTARFAYNWALAEWRSAGRRVGNQGESVGTCRRQASTRSRSDFPGFPQARRL